MVTRGHVIECLRCGGLPLRSPDALRGLALVRVQPLCRPLLGDRHPLRCRLVGRHALGALSRQCSSRGRLRVSLRRLRSRLCRGRCCGAVLLDARRQLRCRGLGSLPLLQRDTLCGHPGSAWCTVRWKYTCLDVMAGRSAHAFTNQLVTHHFHVKRTCGRCMVIPYMT